MKLQENIVDGSKSAGKNLAKIVLIASLAIASVVEKSQAQVINKQANGVERVEKIHRSGAEQLQDPNQTPEQFLEENKNLKLSPERIKYINEKYYYEYKNSRGLVRSCHLRLREDTPLQDFFDICVLAGQKNYKKDDVAFVYDNKKVRNINPLILLKNLIGLTIDNNPNLQNIDALRLMKDRLEYITIRNSNITSLEPIRNSKTIRSILIHNKKIDPGVFKSLVSLEGVLIGKEIAELYGDFFTKEFPFIKYITEEGSSVFEVESEK